MTPKIKGLGKISWSPWLLGAVVLYFQVCFDKDTQQKWAIPKYNNNKKNLSEVIAWGSTDI